MKTMTVLALAALTLPATAQAQRRGTESGSNTRGACMATMLEALPLQDLDANEEADLLFLREEEKLARDVYLALDDEWGLRVFGNIARAEQTHMDAVLMLLVRYGIPDPADHSPPGVFEDPVLQDLYDDLVAQGRESRVDALIVGATIEDLDINDLLGMIERTDNEDLALVYQNLMKGSRNHMRAFAGLLEANGISYEAQFISADLLEQILSTPKERGPVDASGEPTTCQDAGGASGPGRDDFPDRRRSQGRRS